MTIYFSFIIIAIISYLLGSLNFGVILSKYLEKDDVRRHGSGNAGSTNMLRSFGKKVAVLTIAGDMLKAFLAIFIALKIFEHTPMLLVTNPFSNLLLFVKSFAGFFCVLGHIFPCFFKFKGGKGVATAGAMVFAIDWKIALILLAVFIVVLLLTRYVSLGSITMAVLYPILMHHFYSAAESTIVAAVFTLIILITHLPNIKKLIKHTESKVDFIKIKKSK